MSEFKGTPGEWNLELYSGGAFEISVGKPIDGMMLLLASRGGHARRIEEMHANARLLAASKDLLEALQSVVMYFWTADREPGGLSEGDVESLARAAIAKALGEDAC